MFNSRRSISEIFSSRTTSDNGVAAHGDLFAKNREPVHDVVYASELKQNEIPLLIVPEEDDVEGFFADVATFYPDLLPLSAICHVADSQLHKAKLRENSALGIRKINALVGLSFVEVVLRLAKTGVLHFPTFAACRKSLAFTLARSEALYPSLPLKNAYSKWCYANEILGSQFNSEISEDIFRISEIVFGRMGWPARPKGREIVALKALSGFVSDEGAERSFVEALLAVHKNLEDLLERIAGPFDGRMAVFEEMLGRINDSPENTQIDAVAIGYFANRISPGSFAHFSVLLRHVSRHPTALIWYGVFAGLNMEQASADAVTAIGRKIRRDLEEPFFLRCAPQADVCVDELVVLLRLPNIANALKPSTPQSLRVSLLPGVDIFAKFPEEKEIYSDDDSRKRLLEIQSRQVRIRESMVNSLRSLDGAIEFLDLQIKNSGVRSRK